MCRIRASRFVLFLIFATVCIKITGCGQKAQPLQAQRNQAHELLNQNKIKEAALQFEALCWDNSNTPALVAEDLQMALLCYIELKEGEEAEALRQKAIKQLDNNWKAQWLLAQSYLDGGESFVPYKPYDHTHFGKKPLETDYAQAKSLILSLIPLVEKNTSSKEKGDIYLYCAEFLIKESLHNGGASLLKNHEPLDAPTKKSSPIARIYSPQDSAVVDIQGNPIFHELPKSWDQAKNYGERLRWLLHQSKRCSRSHAHEAISLWSNYCSSLFGLQTLMNSEFGRILDTHEIPSNSDSIWKLETLEENETIAHLSSGIKRFKFPESHNYISMWKKIKAYDSLAEEFEFRRQFDQAAIYLRKYLRTLSPNQKSEIKTTKDKLNQILSPWCRFEQVSSQPYGQPAKVDMTLRNAEHIHFKAYKIHLAWLLEMYQSEVRSRPLDYKTMNYEYHKIDKISIEKIIKKERDRYVGGKIEEWKQTFPAKSGHKDSRVTIETPLTKPGAYLLKARAENGNETQVVVFINKHVLMARNIKDDKLLFVADALTGQPVPNTKIEFFGYQIKDTSNQLVVNTRRDSQLTDEKGMLLLTFPHKDKQKTIYKPENCHVPKDYLELELNYQWLVSVKHKNNHVDFLNLAENVYGKHRSHYFHQQTPSEPKRKKVSHGFTDRPVYRPGQTVNFKIWLNQVRFGEAIENPYANLPILVEIQDPRGNTLYEETLTLDSFGGLEGSLQLKEKAILGQYRISLPNEKLYPVTFQVEEYKKTAFEVEVLPPTANSVAGDVVEIQVKANYHMGTPIANADVLLRVERKQDSLANKPTSKHQGELWSKTQHGFEWYQDLQQKPLNLTKAETGSRYNELSKKYIVIKEAKTDAHGICKIKIPTEPPTTLPSTYEQVYSITAEVTDPSLRTLIGQSMFKVARQPFWLKTRLGHNYYYQGDSIDFHTKTWATTGKTFSGAAKARLYHVHFNDQGALEENEVKSWDLPINERGQGLLSIPAQNPGQYRITCEIDWKENIVKDSVLFNVFDRQLNLADARFDALELIPDKNLYQPGEMVNLALNSNQKGAFVLLFIHTAVPLTII